VCVSLSKAKGKCNALPPVHVTLIERESFEGFDQIPKHRSSPLDCFIRWMYSPVVEGTFYGTLLSCDFLLRGGLRVVMTVAVRPNGLVPDGVTSDRTHL
jgi:hypothetical protein